MQIVRIDPHDESALRRWHATYLEADTRGRPFATPWMYEEARATAQGAPVAFERIFLSGLVDDEAVCVAQLILPLKDNLDHADLHVHTHPDHRRRGYGTAMLARVEELVREHGAVDEFRIVFRRVEGLDDILVRLDPSPELSDADRRTLQEHVAKELQVGLGIRASVELVEPGSLPRWDHKARRIEDQRAEVPF